jgi:hypothetical protein
MNDRKMTGFAGYLRVSSKQSPSHFSVLPFFCQLAAPLGTGLCIFALIAGCSRTADLHLDPPRQTASAATPATGFNPEFVDLHAREHRPTEDPSFIALALIFILPDCPIANSFLPEINRLHETFSPQGVHFLLVHADSDVSAEKAKEHAREYEIQPPVILDPHHDWVKKASVTISPEAVVFSPQGQIVYRGRINDQYVGLGKRRGTVTFHDLKDALSAILTDQPIAQPKTEAIGCPIPTISTENKSH